MTNYAVVRNYKSVGQVRDYLPSNYEVIHIDENGMGVVIAGEDDHGWTLEDYVIPRLATALLPCNQVWPCWTSLTADLGTVVDIPEHWLEGHGEAA